MPSKTPSKKMKDYRARLRASGLRPIQIWVPDIRAKNFAEEARRQSILASSDPGEKETMDFIEAITEFEDE